MKHAIVPIKGMHCRSCELLLEEKIGEIQGVKRVRVSYQKGTADIGYGPDDIPSDRDLERAVADAGYEIGRKEKAAWLSGRWNDYRELGIAALILLGLYYVAKATGLLGISVNTNNVTLPFAFVIGLIAGVSTCMALVGGLILGISARHAELHPEATAWEKFRPHLYFNLGRVGGYAVLGGLLGALGSFLKLSGGVLAFLTLAVGFVMIVLGLKLTGVSPRLTETSITLPSWIAKGLGLTKHQKEYSHKSTAITGALSFFLPCGFTQAMQIFAVSTGSFGKGALVMGLFALGTAPALLGIGGLTSVIKGAVAKRFYAVVGLAVLTFGLFNFGNGLALAGIKAPVGAAAEPAAGVNLELEDGKQVIRMTQNSSGYSPNRFTLKRGVPVKWVITSESVYTCAASIFVPSLGIGRQLQQGENVIEFTPEQTGQIPFSCSMGMYRGVFDVVEDPTAGGAAGAGVIPVAAAAGLAAPLAAKGSSCGSGGGCGCGGGRPKPTLQGATQPPTGQGGDVQKIASRENSSALTPYEFTVSAGQPVEWTITPSNAPVGCMTAFFSPELGIRAYDAYPEPTVIRFTPVTPGDYDVTCLAMGMWRATIHVR